MTTAQSEFDTATGDATDALNAVSGGIGELNALRVTSGTASDALDLAVGKVNDQNALIAIK